MVRISHSVAVTLLLATLVACSTATPPSASLTPSPAVSCQPPPVITVTDAAGRESIVPILLTCDGAIAAVKAALVEPPAPVVALEFGYGRYCPPRARCGPFAITEPPRGYVVVTFDGAPTQVANVAADSSGETLLINVERVTGPGQ